MTVWKEHNINSKYKPKQQLIIWEEYYNCWNKKTNDFMSNNITKLCKEVDIQVAYSIPENRFLN